MTPTEELRDIANALLEDAVTINQHKQCDRLFTLAERLDGKCIVDTWTHQDGIDGSYTAALGCGCDYPQDHFRGHGSTKAEARTALQARLDDET